MARNVYTVRVIDSPPDIGSTEFSPVPIESVFVISHMTATPGPGGEGWVDWVSGSGVYNLSTGICIWALPAIPYSFTTWHWRGRYVLQYPELLYVQAPGWGVSITAYSLALP